MPLGVVVTILVWIFLRKLADGRHDALHVHHHGLDHAGQDAEFLLQEAAGSGNAVADKDLVRGAAHAHEVHALGALGFGIGDRSPDLPTATTSISANDGS